MYFYALGVLFNMVYGYFAAIFVLGKYIRTTFSRLERKVNQREILSLYFNFALMYPIFKECLTVKNQKVSYKNLRKCIILSTYLLVGDILQDEVVEQSNSSFVVLAGKLEAQVNEFIDEKLRFMISNLQEVQASGNDSNLTNVLEQKGLWLPALLYPIGKNWSDRELQCFQFVGAWLKLADDFADREKDKQNGIVTLCNSGTSEQARSVYKEYGEKVKDSLLHFSNNSLACTRFWRNISWQTNVFVAFEEKVSMRSIDQQKKIRKSLILQLFEMIKASFTLQKE